MSALLDAGTSPTMEPKQLQRVRMVNQVAVFVSCLLLPYLAVFVALGSDLNASIQVAAIATLGGAVLLNHLGWQRAARVVTLLTGNVLVFLMALLLGRSFGVHFYAFAAIVAPLFFYPDREWRAIGGFVALTVVSTAGANLWLARHAPLEPLPGWSVPPFYLMSLVGGLLTVFAFVLYFYLESRRFEASLLHANREMTRLSETDGLTGVANRRKLEQSLHVEWERAVRGNYLLSVVLLDVDHFKRFNDQYGHPAGDDVLVRLCEAFRSGVRRVYDLVGRYGGEEFLFILPATDGRGASLMAERVRLHIDALRIPHAGNDGYGHVTCSFGVSSCHPLRGGDVFDLIRQADQALYQAKSEGRNRVVPPHAMAPAPPGLDDGSGRS